MFGPKKINVPDGILLKYAMHVISKWPQYCIFKIKFSWFSIIKSYWRRILRLGIRLVVKFGYDKNSSFSLNFDAISLHFFLNSSENHGQADSGALEHFRLTPGRQNSKNHQKSLFLYRSRSISTRLYSVSVWWFFEFCHPGVSLKCSNAPELACPWFSDEFF